LDALVNDASSEVRWRAAMVIGSMGGQDIVAELEHIRAQESHSVVLQHIDQAMQMLESAY